MPIVLWFILSALMLVSIDILSFGLKRVGWSRFVSTFFLFYAQIIVTEFILGLFFALNSIDLVLANITITSILTYILFRKFGSGVFKSYLVSVRKYCVDTCKKLKNDRLLMALLILAAMLLAWIIFLGVIFPALDFDGNVYHLTFVGYAIQNHAFFDVPTSLGWLAGYPKGGEFIEMWYVLITHNDMLVELVQVPFLFLGIYALYETSKSLGASKRNARFTAILFLFLPVVLNQLKTDYIDVMLCALFFTAIAMVVKKKLGKLDFVIIGIIFSLIISMKYTGFLFIAALVPLLLWNLYKNQSRGPKPFIQSYIRPLLIVFVGTLFGLYWYIKNYILYHNPLYPFGLKVSGLNIFPGKTFQDATASAINSLGLPNGWLNRIWFVWTEQKSWYGCMYNYDSNFSGFGPIWFIVLIPAIIVSVYFAIKNKNYIYMVITALLALVFAIFPSDYYTRYTMFITAIGIFALAIVLSNINVKVANIVKVATILLAIFVVATNFTLCNYPLGSVKNQIKSIEAGDSRSIAYEGTFGKAYVFMQGRVKANEVVAYDSSPYFIYVLWKPDFSNIVTYIPANSKNQWYVKVKEERVKYVFTDIGSKEYEWIKTDSRFTDIYKDSQNEIFQVN